MLDGKDKGERFYADSEYTSEKQNQIISNKEIINCVNEKWYRANPLTDEQKLKNTEKSKIRARVKHIFGFMEKSMNQIYLKFIGFKRTNTSVELMNLTYNMFRKIQLQTNWMGTCKV